MAVTDMAALTGVAVFVGVVMTCGLCLDRRHRHRTVDEFGLRLRNVGPYLAIAALFFLGKRATHGYSVRLSYALDWNITDELYAAEGAFVAQLQDAVPEATLGFFSVMYMFGFPFLLVAAPILYFALPSQRRLKELLVAYVCNYVIGTICYTLFIAYGPRNHLSSVDGLMYQFYPQTQDLTAAVSSNTDVFPSLHTSLTVVVLLFAWRSRREYPRWVPVASIVGFAVVFSTMYLGIHWLLDVVAGIVLGAGSVVAAERIVACVEGDTSEPTVDEHDGIPADASD